jgi:hypothetical protein
MKSIEELLTDMTVAVAANDHPGFDGLERELLARFSNGFAGMPKDVYERYLQVDRGWPAVAPPRVANREAESDARAELDLGPDTPFQAKLPQRLYDWLTEICQTTGANRSNVLQACVLVIRENPAIERAVIERASPRDSGSKD